MPKLYTSQWLWFDNLFYFLTLFIINWLSAGQRIKIIVENVIYLSIESIVYTRILHTINKYLKFSGQSISIAVYCNLSRLVANQLNNML